MLVALPFNRVLLYAASCVYPDFPTDFHVVEVDDPDIEEIIYVDEIDAPIARDLVEDFLRSHGHDVSHYNYIKAFAYNEAIDYLSAVQIYD